MHVICTAGHVDHGKSTLVQALTGVDPDRLREEKERGMTIDLGFAWLPLEKGDEASIIDVPGHEHFVNNMLAGVGGVDLAMLIVAADESIMPQTREHLAILDLINVNRVIVAITKKELVEDDWLDLVFTDVQELLKSTSFSGSKIIAVSASTGEGLSTLMDAINQLLGETEIRSDLGRPRLPIDRSFTMSGFGTIVTGTLIDGKLSVGQEVEVLPGGSKARIRGIQTHGKKIGDAIPGSRVAANLSGIDHKGIQRGNVLTSPGWLKSTVAMDVSLSVLPDAPRELRHNMFITVHTGSNETVGRLRLLESDRVGPGDSTWAQIKLENPIVVVKGDHFVLRSNRTTMGGGSIIDPHAKRHRRKHLPLLEKLSVMQQGSTRDILLKSIGESEPAEFTDIVNKTNLESGTAILELETMETDRLIVSLGKHIIGPGTYMFTSDGWISLGGQAKKFLNFYHQQFPLREGAPKEELRSRLGISVHIFDEMIASLERDGLLIEEGPTIRLPDHERNLSDAQNGIASDYIKRLTTTPYSPPTDSTIDPEIMNLLEHNGQIVRVNETIAFAKTAYTEMVDEIRKFVQTNGQITVADVRDLFNTSRKYSLSLLEHLDAQKITQRVGDIRILR
ncbi:MAG: selenocysteine-specific translation elongation factor [SAR202 cluster bacterium]|nr:selenocysteine-specific translation elongation factor [SAR202 cluster bacterium]